MYIFRRELAYLFTEDDELAEMVVYALPIALLMTIGDYMQGVLSGAIKATGLQHYATVFCLISYWIVSMPITYVLAFVLDYGLRGIWGGIPVASALVGSSFLIMLYSTDYPKLSERIVEKLKHEPKGKIIF